MDMKKYLNTIKISAAFLLLFPFLGFPELWENIYVIIFGFIVGTSAILLHHKSGLVKEQDEESSLQEYIQELKDRFKDQTKESTEDTTHTKSRISEVTVNHD
jgi:uncharacterized membrane protein